MVKTTRFSAGLTALLVSAGAIAASGIELEPAHNDPSNINSLQRGARNFMNYCAGCHSAKYVRFNTLGRDLNLSEDQLIENLMFNAEQTFDTIQATMPLDAAARWFGHRGVCRGLAGHRGPLAGRIRVRKSCPGPSLSHRFPTRTKSVPKRRTVRR